MLLARAALGRGRAVVDARARGPGGRGACSSEALGALGEEDSPLRARLLARLSLELYYAGEPERRMALSEEAVAIARRIGDPATLASAASTRATTSLWRPENVEERLEVAAELRRIAEESGDLELELEGAGWTVVDLLELGDVDGRRHPDRRRRDARRRSLQRPLYLWWTSLFRCTRAQIAGDFDEAERLANETLAIGQREQAENALHYYAMAMFNIRREQGRLGEVEDAVRALHRAVPGDSRLALHAGADARRAGAARARRARCSRRSPSRASTRSRATPTG